MTGSDLIYRGIIIKQTNYGDAHRMLWIFTQTDGIIKAVRYGVRGKKTSNAAAFQLFSYADFKLRQSSGDIMTAVSADVIDAFYPLSEDITKLALVSYLADITYGMLGEANPDGSVLSLCLNSVYAAAYRDDSHTKIKTVYELKLMCTSGYMPDIDGCKVCGGQGMYYSCDSGSLMCRDHHGAGDIKISSDAVALMRYIIRCDDKKMLSFDLNDESPLNELSAVTEKYVCTVCDRTFQSLDYFYSIL